MAGWWQDLVDKVKDATKPPEPLPDPAVPKDTQHGAPLDPDPDDPFNGSRRPPPGGGPYRSEDLDAGSTGSTAVPGGLGREPNTGTGMTQDVLAATEIFAAGVVAAGLATAAAATAAAAAAAAAGALEGAAAGALEGVGAGGAFEAAGAAAVFGPPPPPEQFGPPPPPEPSPEPFGPPPPPEQFGPPPPPESHDPTDSHDDSSGGSPFMDEPGPADDPFDDDYY